MFEYASTFIYDGITSEDWNISGDHTPYYLPKSEECANKIFALAIYLSHAPIFKYLSQKKR